jgi:hypothetical protein
MTYTTRAHGPLVTDVRRTSGLDASTLEGSAGDGARLTGVGVRALFHGGPGHGGGMSTVPIRVPGGALVRGVLAGTCLLVLLTGCSLDVDALRQGVETHWAGVEETSPPPATPMPSTPGASGLPVVDSVAASVSCPQGGSGACRV